MKKLLMLLIGMVSSPILADSIDQIQQPILMDGRCEDTPWTKVSAIDVGAGATLKMVEDELYFYLCIALPDKSYGTIDLYFLDPADSVPMNFHISAQKGERKRREDGSWPDYVWENETGWYGNVVVMKWNREDGFSCCHVSHAREIQIRKDKIADVAGRVRMMFEMRAIALPDGSRKGQAQFPAGADTKNSDTWASIDLSN